MMVLYNGQKVMLEQFLPFNANNWSHFAVLVILKVGVQMQFIILKRLSPRIFFAFPTKKIGFRIDSLDLFKMRVD